MARWTLPQIRDLAAWIGFPDPDMAAAVAMAESEGNPDAVGDVDISPPDGSVGLWQINAAHHPQFDPKSLHDPVVNARAALAVSGGGVYWKPWTTYRLGAVSKFLPVDHPMRQRWMRIQHLLNKAGAATPPLVLDGDPGQKTRAAVVHFQSHHGLPPTGNVEDPTFVALSDAAGESVGIGGDIGPFLADWQKPWLGPSDPYSGAWHDDDYSKGLTGRLGGYRLRDVEWRNPYFRAQEFGFGKVQKAAGYGDNSVAELKEYLDQAEHNMQVLDDIRSSALGGGAKDTGAAESEHALLRGRYSDAAAAAHARITRADAPPTWNPMTWGQAVIPDWNLSAEPEFHHLAVALYGPHVDDDGHPPPQKDPLSNPQGTFFRVKALWMMLGAKVPSTDTPVPTVTPGSQPPSWLPTMDRFEHALGLGDGSEHKFPWAPFAAVGGGILLVLLLVRR